MRRPTILLSTAPFILSLLVAVGCDSGSSPVAPTGATLTVSANPASIGLDGTSEITVVARDMSGAPVRTGTEIRLTTTLGSIDNVAVTDRDGVARSRLRADGLPGIATVQATSGLATVTPAGVTVTIGPADPALTAAFTPSGQGLTVLFNDASTGNPTAWEWRFGDGAGSTDQNPVHTYAAAGTYAVTLTVRSAVDEDSHSAFVTVPPEEATPPEAAFEATAEGLRVAFRDTSMHNPSRWRWSFGDGSGSGEQNPVHLYAAAGSYVVRLTASNAAGEDTTSQVVEVTP